MNDDFQTQMFRMWQSCKERLENRNVLRQTHENNQREHGTFDRMPQVPPTDDHRACVPTLHDLPMTKLHIASGQGITRTVVLVGRYALKFPTLKYGWDKFLRGLLSNMTERVFSNFPVGGKYHVAPTIWALPGGWMNVQCRALPLTLAQWQSVLNVPNIVDLHIDLKRSNFGTINGRIVIIDYGELT